MFADAEADTVVCDPDMVAVAASGAADSSHWRAEAVESLGKAQQVIWKKDDVDAGSVVAAALERHIDAGWASPCASPATVAVETYLVEEAI